MRWALAVNEAVPVVAFDARDRLSVRDALLVVLERARDRAMKATRWPSRCRVLRPAGGGTCLDVQSGAASLGGFGGRAGAD